MDLELGQCGYGQQSFTGYNICGSPTIDSSSSSGINFSDVGDFAVDQINATSAFADPNNKMNSVTTHTCYPNGYPQSSSSSSSSSKSDGLGTPVIAGIVAGGASLLIIGVLLYHFYVNPLLPTSVTSVKNSGDGHGEYQMTEVGP
jgi:hypothetical protein